MKKTLLALLICSLLLASCQKFDETSKIDDDISSISSDVSDNVTDDFSDDASDDSSKDDTSEDDEKEFDFSILSKEELREYVSLGQYKGLESEKYVVEVTDKDIENEIKEILSENGSWKEVKNRAAKKDDLVKIDFVGYIGGVAFEGGTASNQSIVIGEGKYIDGFEEGLIGAKSGEKVSLNLTFPENYGNKDLAGKAVVFDVTVKEIQEFVIPELSEEIIKKYSDEKETTADGFKKFLKEKLLKRFELEKKENSKDKYWKQVLNNSTIIKYPDGIIEEYVNGYIDQYSMIASFYGVTLEEYLGMTKEAFVKICTKDAEESYKTKLVLWAAINEENYDSNIVEEKYKAWLDDFAVQLGTTSQSMISQYGDETLKEIYVFDNFLSYIYETRIEVEPKEDTKTENNNK